MQSKKNIELKEDNSFGMKRIEVYAENAAAI